MTVASARGCEAFVAAVPAALAWQELDAVLGVAIDRVSLAWPALHIEEEQLLSYLGARLQPADAAAFHAGHLEDLALACACVQQAAGALLAFDAQVMPRIDAVVQRYDSNPTFLDDVRQALRQKLFMSPARIADYSGHGPMVSWLRAAAARTALNLLRPEKRQARADDDELDVLPFSAPDPTLAILKGRHRAVFRAAFASALAELPTRERTALKLNALEGLSLDKIGAMYGKDKSTVSRWVSHAQQTLLEKTRSYLALSLDLHSGEVESLMVALQSQLASSLIVLLNEKGDATS